MTDTVTDTPHSTHTHPGIAARVVRTLLSPPVPELVGLAVILVLMLLTIGCVSGCTATRSTYTKAPYFVEGFDPMEQFEIDMSGLAGEALLWDNYNKNIALLSTKDEALEGVEMNIEFGADGQMSRMSLSIGSKTAISSDPSRVAWDGFGSAIEAYLGPDGLPAAIGVILGSLSGIPPVPAPAAAPAPDHVVR